MLSGWHISTIHLTEIEHNLQACVGHMDLLFFWFLVCSTIDGCKLYMFVIIIITIKPSAEAKQNIQNVKATELKCNKNRITVQWTSVEMGKIRMCGAIATLVHAHENMRSCFVPSQPPDVHVSKRTERKPNGTTKEKKIKSEIYVDLNEDTHFLNIEAIRI